MKKLIFVIPVFLFMFLNIQFSYSQVAQEWVQRYNGPANFRNEAKSMAVDNSGNVYVTGSSAGSGIGYFPEYATIKYNSLGAQQWIQIYNGPGYSDFAFSIAIDNSGNVYVTGQSAGSGSNYDYATIKYNSSGVQQWVQRYNGPGNNNDYATSIAVDNSGNVYVTGQSAGSGSNYDYATIKYNSSGAQQWVQRYNGPGNNNDYATSIAVDNSGNVYVTGYSYGVVSVNDYTTIKYDSSGAQQWIQRYNGQGNNNDYARSIAIDNSGNVYVTGGSHANNTVYNDYDYATIKYNSLGAQQWVQRYNGQGNGFDDATSIAVDNLENVYVTGYSGSDYATIKYNSSGAQQWVQRYNGPGNSQDKASSIAVDNSGNVYVTGYSYGVGSNPDYATIKYNSSGAQQWVQRYNGPGNNNGPGGSIANSIAVDNSGNVYVTGGSVGSGSGFDYATIKYSQDPEPAPIIKSLNLTALVEGFYNNVTNLMVRDTIRVYLRNISSPFNIIDSVKSVLDQNGNGTFNFYKPVFGIPYYIVIKHRNSIETWSSNGQTFLSSFLSYDFTTNSSQAYGNNMVQKGSRYCVYSGDVNQDRTVDGSDLSLADNDAYNYLTGYVATDVNGDNFVDASDISVVDNNAYNYVSVIRP